MFTGMRLNTGGADATEESGMHDNMIGNKFPAWPLGRPKMP